MPSTPATTVIRLRAEAFAAWMARLRIGAYAQQAEYIGVDASTLRRIRRGEIVPGEQFIAACMAKYDRKFEELFQVTS
jgi:transcriptional regulator with XRE-family HTH domain